MFCPECGTQVNEGAKFCYRCGYSLAQLPCNQGEIQQQAPPPCDQAEYFYVDPELTISAFGNQKPAPAPTGNFDQTAAPIYGDNGRAHSPQAQAYYPTGNFDQPPAPTYGNNGQATPSAWNREPVNPPAPVYRAEQAAPKTLNESNSKKIGATIIYPDKHNEIGTLFVSADELVFMRKSKAVRIMFGFLGSAAENGEESLRLAVSDIARGTKTRYGLNGNIYEITLQNGAVFKICPNIPGDVKYLQGRFGQ